jgi:uncharacterized protein YdeI (YjbR/CyaY-like superfamily)
MSSKDISGGTAHTLPNDLRKVLTSSHKALSTWEDITPLARNEWICWTISVKTPETRKQHVRRFAEELAKGKRRPCCWIGCVHRKDKPTSASQKYILNKKGK